jgi:hypothetical protein
MLVPVYQTVTHYISGDSNLHSHCCEYLKSQMPVLAYKNFFVTLCGPYILTQKITMSSICKYLSPYNLVI